MDCECKFIRVPHPIPVICICLSEAEVDETKQYLSYKYPIYATEVAPYRQIPTCPYQWPNGQGDVAKFLEGERNSGRWAKEHGRVYRIWSGMNSEM